MSKGTCTIESTQKDMRTVSVVRRNLMTVPGYSPYCGAMCRVMPRTRFNGEQFVCPCCGWVSSFPKEFIDEYKKKWRLYETGRIHTSKVIIRRNYSGIQ